VFTDFARKQPHLASTAMRSNASETSRDRIFVVERFVSGLDKSRLEDLARRERAEVANMRWSGLDIVYVGSVAIPQDETCLCFFRGPDARSVSRANLGVSLASDRIVEALLTRPSFLAPGRGRTSVDRKEHDHEATDLGAVPRGVLGH
jgi:hypothetical protein